VAVPVVTEEAALFQVDDRALDALADPAPQLPDGPLGLRDTDGVLDELVDRDRSVAVQQILQDVPVGRPRERGEQFVGGRGGARLALVAGVALGPVVAHSPARPAGECKYTPLTGISPDDAA
jgi:hypothetical protein